MGAPELRLVTETDTHRPESAEKVALRERLGQFDSTSENASRASAIGLVLVRAARQKKPTLANEAVLAWLVEHSDAIPALGEPYPRSGDLREAVLAGAEAAEEALSGEALEAAWERSRRIHPIAHRAPVVLGSSALRAWDRPFRTAFLVGAGGALGVGLVVALLRALRR